MFGKSLNKRVGFILILFFCFSFFVFGQDKQDEQDNQLREEILSIYKSQGEQGLRDFVKKQKDKISNKFIVDFAKAGVRERKEEWLKACEIMAVQKNDEETLADVWYQAGDYFRLLSGNTKALDYFERAMDVYRKLNNPIALGNVYLRKGVIYFFTGDNVKSIEMYDNALIMFERAGDKIGQGNIYEKKAPVYFRMGDNSKALEMYDKALSFFTNPKAFVGRGNVFKGKGNIYLYTGEKSKALEMYDKALPLYKKAGDIVGQGNIFKSKGDIYFFYTGENSKALEMYDKALLYYRNAGIPLNMGGVYKSKGNTYLRIGEIEKALEMYDKALHLFNKARYPIGQGNVCASKADIYTASGENLKALREYEAALSFFKKAGEPRSQAWVYMGMGDIYLNIGNSARAFELYDKTLLLYEKAGDPLGQGNLYERKGDIYSIAGDNLKAIAMYQKAFSIFERIEDTIGRGNIRLSMGRIYSKIGKKDKAIRMYDEALLFFKKVGQPIGQGNAYLSKGGILVGDGEYANAIEMYDKALLLFKKSRQLIGQGNVWLEKGGIYLRNGENLNAVHMYDRALPLYAKAGDIESESNALYYKAKAFVKLAKKKKALELFEKAITKLEKIRTQTVSSDMKRTFMEKVYDRYEESVLFMLKNKYEEKAFQYVETLRNRVFLDGMSEGLVRLDKGLRPELKKRRESLMAKLSLLSKKIFESACEKDGTTFQELKEQYRSVEDKFEELLIKIRLTNPLYASVIYQQPISVHTLQKEVLKKGEILLSYFPFQNKINVFLISKGDFIVTLLKETPMKVNKTVEQYLTSVKENNHRRIRKYGKELYTKLFKPLEASIKDKQNLIIVPDGELVKIPFETLAMDTKTSRKPVYLLEKYRIKYIQSASALSIFRKHYQQKGATDHFIGFGDPVYDYENFAHGKPEQGSPTRSPGEENSIENEIKEIHRDRYARAGGIMNRLPQSGEEVQTIARLFEKESLKNVIHLRDQATEANAKAANMKDFDYIHFSCHGLLNDDFQSLVLSQLPPDKSSEDGYFTLNEIMNCDYNAKLVVLSACETGKGKMYKGEGVTGLTRAVMYAGTPAVVASLWKVDDRATKELMVMFYQNMLERNMDKVEALRQAKLDLINDENYASPYYWSAFIMYGE